MTNADYEEGNLLFERGYEKFSLRSRFRSEQFLKSWAGELDADEATAGRRCFRDVNHAPARGKISVVPARHLDGARNANLEIGTDGHFKAREERGAATA